VSPTAAIVTELAVAARGLALGSGVRLALASVLVGAVLVGAGRVGVDAVLMTVSEQAGRASRAADPAIAQTALTVFRMRINLAWYSPARRRDSLLILHGQEDTNVPLGQTVYFHRALSQYGVEHELVVYPREGHQITERQHQIDLLQRIRSWFARWLG
jgi:dipeptidyl aminopeptidase/acylaminoacyl peptidase